MLGGLGPEATVDFMTKVVAATDADVPTTFQNWSIVSGNTDGIFAINPATGELTVIDNTNLDFDTLPTSYALGITVADGTNTSAVETVTVTLSGPAEHTEVFTLDEPSTEVPFPLPEGTRSITTLEIVPPGEYQREITATSVVPPPMSTTMLPTGSITSSPMPIAAAIGSSTR